MTLNDLIAELCEALDEEDTESYTRKGYEMVGQYFRTPVNTGDLELTQQRDNVSMVRDQYSVMKKDE
ncbi:hypothetical protein [Brevibacillus sp. NRS-1366]|uniref:hypothetical protein n=1 Tax=Brevibacillus sp. NRS-1366 TaxID=3233899 RepID=UPI003D22FC9A